MRLHSPYFLLLLFLIPLFHQTWKARAQGPKLKFPLPIPKTLRSVDPERFFLYAKYLAFTFLVLALARPQSSHHQVERTVSGVDIMLVLDVSASMNIEDLAEASRLEIAKETIESFVKGRANDRIGLLVFSGEPLSLVPPTLDYGLLISELKKIETGILKDGTAIGDGLSVGINHLRKSKAKSRVIILLTDGDNNLGQVGPETAGELAAGYHLKVYTIAIGKEGRVRLPIRQKTLSGTVVTSYQWLNNALNTELLEKIAEITGGKFFRVGDAETLQAVFQEIDQLEKTEVKTREQVRYEEKFKLFAILGVLTLLAELLGRTWVRRIP